MMGHAVMTSSKPQCAAAARESGTLERHYQRWTQREDNVLWLHWGERTLDDLASELARSSDSVYRRARALGLDVGAPRGFEYVSAAAERCGFSYGGFLSVLHWGGVPIRAALSRPSAVGRDHIVESAAADDAVAAFCASETLEQASRRLGPVASTLRIWLVEAARENSITLPKRLVGTRWRIPTTTLDRVFALRMSREAAKAAARRVGVSWNTLKAWLREAGVPRPRSNRWTVNPSDVDRVVAAKRAANSQAFRMKRPTKAEEATS